MASTSLSKSQSPHLEIGLGMLDPIIIQKIKCVPGFVLFFLSIREKEGWVEIEARERLLFNPGKL